MHKKLMLILSSRPFRPVLWAALAVTMLFTGSAYAQCSQELGCGPVTLPNASTPVQVHFVDRSANLITVPASSGATNFTLAISQFTSTPLPAVLPKGNYPAWCGRDPHDPTGDQTAGYTLEPVDPWVSPDPSPPKKINNFSNINRGPVIDEQPPDWPIFGKLSLQVFTATGLTTRIGHS